MKTAGAILGILLLGGCADQVDYSAFAEGRRPALQRIASLDARLRALMGEASPDSTALLRIVDTLRSKSREDTSTGDSTALEAVAETLSALGVEPVLQPSDSDLVPSLAWERRRAGCVPLVLFWIEALRERGVEAAPVFLPGHLAIEARDGQRIETLRGGIIRSASFYDSAFRLEQRPYYKNLKPDPQAVVASMLVQAGLLEWRSGRTKAAVAAFRAAAKLCPGLPEAEGNLGLVLEQRGHAEEAAKHLRLALAGDPLSIKARTRWKRMTSKEASR